MLAQVIYGAYSMIKDQSKRDIKESSQQGLANFFDHYFKVESGKNQGGSSKAVGVHIVWQNGIIDEHNQQNGAIVEDVIECAIARLEHYQSAEEDNFNRRAIIHLRNAIAELKTRTEDRILRGVLNTDEA